MVLWLVWAGWALAWLRMLWRGGSGCAGPAFRRIEPVVIHIKSNRKPEWTVRQLVLLKAHLPNAGCRTLAVTFNRVFAHRDVTVSNRSCIASCASTRMRCGWRARRLGPPSPKRWR